MNGNRPTSKALLVGLVIGFLLAVAIGWLLQ